MLSDRILSFNLFLTSLFWGLFYYARLYVDSYWERTATWNFLFWGQGALRSKKQIAAQ
jgi:hypothetical protein